jgi:hypothetical protein
VYADNAYVWHPVLGWYSLDGEKMESSVTGEAVFAFNMHVMEEVWLPTTVPFTDGNEDRKAAHVALSAYNVMKKYLGMVTPTLTTQAIAQFFNQQVPVPGQVSGSVGTAYYNEVKMAGPARDLASLLCESDASPSEIGHEYLGPEALTPKAMSLFEQHGVVIKTELHTPAVEILDPVERRLIKLDLLGCDAMYITKFGVTAYLPVLDPDRFLKSIVFRKSKAKAGAMRVLSGELDGGEELYSNLITMMKFHQLYMFGGWAFDGFNHAITQLLSGLWGVIADSVDDPVTMHITPGS